MKSTRVAFATTLVFVALVSMLSVKGQFSVCRSMFSPTAGALTDATYNRRLDIASVVLVADGDPLPPFPQQPNKPGAVTSMFISETVQTQDGDPLPQFPPTGPSRSEVGMFLNETSQTSHDGDPLPQFPPPQRLG